MVVNEVDFKCALESLSNNFKIPWLYSIEALFKGKDVFASLPTDTDELLFSSICPHLKSSRATRLVDCS